jgi:cathepsin L
MGVCSDCGSGSAWAIHKDDLYSLSEQNLIDCVTLCDTVTGCDVALAYDYVIHKQSGNFSTAKGYPYTRTYHVCNSKAADAKTTIVDFEVVTKSESSLQTVVATYGLVAVAIDASKNAFQLYRS